MSTKLTNICFAYYKIVQVNCKTLKNLITYYRRANNQKAEQTQMSY